MVRGEAEQAVVPDPEVVVGPEPRLFGLLGVRAVLSIAPSCST